MIIPTSRVDKTLGISLQKVYNSIATSAVERPAQVDLVTISKLSSLVEQGRAQAMAQPEIRVDLVAKARLAIQMAHCRALMI